MCICCKPSRVELLPASLRCWRVPMCICCKPSWVELLPASLWHWWVPLSICCNPGWAFDACLCTVVSQFEILMSFCVHLLQVEFSASQVGSLSFVCAVLQARLSVWCVRLLWVKSSLWHNLHVFMLLLQARLSLQRNFFVCFRRRLLQVKLSLNVFISLLQASLSQKWGIFPSVARSSLQLWMDEQEKDGVSYFFKDPQYWFVHNSTGYEYDKEHCWKVLIRWRGKYDYVHLFPYLIGFLSCFFPHCSGEKKRLSFLERVWCRG